MGIKINWTYLKRNKPVLIYLRAKNTHRLWKRRAKKYTDEQAIERQYFRYSGEYPNLDHPETFSEKMQWLKLHYRKDIMTVVADKYEVREYLRKKGYEDLLLPLIGVYDHVKDINWSSLPPRFVMKATHGSGWNLIVKNKKEVNWAIWKKIIKIWLKNNYYWLGREWPYKNMRPRIVVEEYMEDKSGGLMDYKFFCFHGKPHFIQVDRERGTGKHIQRFYDLDWQVLGHARRTDARYDISLDCPLEFKNMIDVAERLSRPFPFVRVDFYEVNNKILFGEMTFYPKSGLPYFRPKKYDKIFGKLLKVKNL